METSQITEGNELIAEFMGVKFHPIVLQWKTAPGYFVKELKYATSWDWIMPVVDKIEKMGYDSRMHVIDSESSYFIDFVDVVNGNTEAACISKSYHEASKIETVWLAVVEFIKAEIQNVSPLIDEKCGKGQYDT